MKTEKEIAQDIISLTQNLEEIEDVQIFTDLYILALQKATGGQYKEDVIREEMRECGEWRI
jgi:hypothetical protein